MNLTSRIALAPSRTTLSSFGTALLSALIAVSTAASAQDGLPPDLPRAGLPVARVVPSDLSPVPVPVDSRAPVLLSISVQVRHAQGRHDLGGNLVFTLPLNSLMGGSVVAGTLLAGTPAVRTQTTAPFRTVVGEESHERETALAPAALRAIVAEIVSASGLAHLAKRAGGLRSRARWSGVVPEVRLRATRLIDETVSLAPTSYDPNRTTQSGGVSTWLEGRATFRLDRLIFASEEPRLLRLETDLLRRRRLIERDAIELLYRFQRARLRVNRSALLEECEDAFLIERRLTMELEVAAGKRLRSLARRQSPCLPLEQPAPAPEASKLEARSPPMTDAPKDLRHGFAANTVTGSIAHAVQSVAHRNQNFNDNGSGYLITAF